jgi:hypothetical protein
VTKDATSQTRLIEIARDVARDAYHKHRATPRGYRVLGADEADGPFAFYVFVTSPHSDAQREERAALRAVLEAERCTFLAQAAYPDDTGPTVAMIFSAEDVGHVLSVVAARWNDMMRRAHAMESGIRDEPGQHRPHLIASGERPEREIGPAIDDGTKVTLLGETYAEAMHRIGDELGSDRDALAFVLERTPDGNVSLIVDTKEATAERYGRDTTISLEAADVFVGACVECPYAIVLLFDHEGSVPSSGTLPGGETIYGLRLLKDLGKGSVPLRAPDYLSISAPSARSRARSGAEGS